MQPDAEVEDTVLEMLKEYRDHYELRKSPWICARSEIPAQNTSKHVLYCYYKLDVLCFVVWIFWGYPPRSYAERMVKKTFRAELKRNIDEQDKLLLVVQHFLTVRWQLRVVG